MAESGEVVGSFVGFGPFAFLVAAVILAPFAGLSWRLEDPRPSAEAFFVVAVGVGLGRRLFWLAGMLLFVEVVVAFGMQGLAVIWLQRPRCRKKNSWGGVVGLAVCALK